MKTQATKREQTTCQCATGMLGRQKRGNSNPTYGCKYVGSQNPLLVLSDIHGTSLHQIRTLLGRLGFFLKRLLDEFHPVERNRLEPILRSRLLRVRLGMDLFRLLFQAFPRGLAPRANSTSANGNSLGPIVSGGWVFVDNINRGRRRRRVGRGFLSRRSGCRDQRLRHLGELRVFYLLCTELEEVLSRFDNGPEAILKRMIGENLETRTRFVRDSKDNGPRQGRSREGRGVKEDKTRGKENAIEPKA